MSDPDVRRWLSAPPTPSSAPSWRFVDRFGTEWRVYDRVRWAPTPSRAEFRFVPPGHRDARSRLFVRSDRVPFELRADDPAWAVFPPMDLSDRALNVQLYVARRAGPLAIPVTAGTTLALEMRRFARDFPHGIPRDRSRRPDVESAARAGVQRTECGTVYVATHARPSWLGLRMLSPCSPLAVRVAQDGD